MAHIPFDPDGILLRRDAIALGYNDNWLRRQRRAGAIVKLRHGAYADPAVWSVLTPAGRHVLLSRAVMQQYDGRVALSHGSAHVTRGGPDWGVPLSTVNITNLFGHGDRTQAGISHHRGIVRVNDVTREHGHWITAPARTAVETAAGLELVPALSVLDWTLHHGLATREELELYADVHLREWPNSIELPIAVRRSSALAESVGETRTRAMFEDHGLEPEPQWEVFHPSGRLAGRVDLLLRKLGLMVEFDGRIKYGRLLRPGQSIADVIRDERAREVLLEELTGLRMLRLIWVDLDRPEATMERVWRAAALRRVG